MLGLGLSLTDVAVFASSGGEPTVVLVPTAGFTDNGDSTFTRTATFGWDSENVHSEIAYEGGGVESRINANINQFVGIHSSAIPDPVYDMDWGWFYAGETIEPRHNNSALAVAVGGVVEGTTKVRVLVSGTDVEFWYALDGVTWVKYHTEAGQAAGSYYITVGAQQQGTVVGPIARVSA